MASNKKNDASKSVLNGYNLTRSWFNYKSNNPMQLRSIHAEMFFYIVDLWNRVGQKEIFGLPTDATMEALEINSYKTYKKALDKLIEHEFIIEIQKSKNVYVSRKIALGKITNVNTSAIDKANINAVTNEYTFENAVETTIIDKQKNKEQYNKEQYNNSLMSEIKISDLEEEKLKSYFQIAEAY
ncbi:hypothetical protein [Cellulophaga sp. L1A9]|uniref:hypothetical protein n=1 Tax=Cellulophaga sp. L1A9 TaxID=2686362 RepID=UPI00131AA41F|nr:hypothetical protein [Cellulophaga sp. L1A9]